MPMLPDCFGDGLAACGRSGELRAGGCLLKAAAGRAGQSLRACWRMSWGVAKERPQPWVHGTWAARRRAGALRGGGAFFLAATFGDARRLEWRRPPASVTQVRTSAGARGRAGRGRRRGAAAAASLSLSLCRVCAGDIFEVDSDSELRDTSVTPRRGVRRWVPRWSSAAARGSCRGRRTSAPVPATAGSGVGVACHRNVFLLFAFGSPATAGFS